MNINNIEKNVSSVIYDRGQEYFEEGFVLDLHEKSSGKWCATIDGNYGEYTINITLDDSRNIKHWDCNCPYDGAICKHVVAVVLSINEELSSAASKPEHKLAEWREIIKNTLEKELRGYLLRYAGQHRDFQDDLILNLSKSKKEINIEKYASMVTRAFDNAEDHHGYINYSDVYEAMFPIDNLLVKADECLADENYHEAYSIAAAVAPECAKVLESLDDSDGHCSGAVSQAFGVVGKVLKECENASLTDSVYSWLQEQMQNPNYDDYGCSDELESLFFEYANTPGRLSDAHLLIDKQLKLCRESDNGSSTYKLTKYLRFKLDLLINESKNVEAEHLIDAHLYLDNFRQMKIDAALDKSDFIEAIIYIKAGIALAEKNSYPGRVLNYKDQLLDIYKKLSDTVNIRRISKELYLDNRRSIEYYRSYKQTFPSEEWPKKSKELIKLLSSEHKKSSWDRGFRYDMAGIFVEEGMWDKLLKEVQDDATITVVNAYDAYLKDDYPEEILEIYNQSISKLAVHTGRNVYVDIVRYMKDMARVENGKVAVNILKKSLLDKYNNRPAMKDEFSKLVL